MKENSQINGFVNFIIPFSFFERERRVREKYERGEVHRVRRLDAILLQSFPYK